MCLFVHDVHYVALSNLIMNVVGLGGEMGLNGLNVIADGIYYKLY